MKFFLALISFVASASAYTITSPGGSSGWTTSPNVVTWTRVSTDPSNFTIVLSNQVETPSYQQVLAALVDGTLGTFTCDPPSTGFPTGDGFQVNFVQDADHLSTILAQSQQFSITQSNSTSSSSTTATTTPLTTTFVTPTNSDSNDLNPTSTTSTSSPSKNGADRTTVAGSAGLIFGVLAAMAL